MAPIMSLRQFGVRLTGGCAAAAAAITLLGWLRPVAVTGLADAAMLVFFAVGFAGMAAVVFSPIAAGGKASQPVRWSWRRRAGDNPFAALRWVPVPLAALLLTFCAVSIPSAVLAWRDSQGFSQDPKGALPGCEWSLVKDHGATQVCVSHTRWSVVGNDFTRGFLGLLVVFLSLECGLFAGQERQLDH